MRVPCRVPRGVPYESTPQSTPRVSERPAGRRCSRARSRRCRRRTRRCGPPRVLTEYPGSISARCTLYTAPLEYPCSTLQYSAVPVEYHSSSAPTLLMQRASAATMCASLLRRAWGTHRALERRSLGVREGYSRGTRWGTHSTHGVLPGYPMGSSRGTHCRWWRRACNGWSTACGRRRRW